MDIIADNWAIIHWRVFIYPLLASIASTAYNTKEDSGFE